MSESHQEIWLMRHGETAWSVSGAHTGRTDIPLTENGVKQAQDLRLRLKGRKFALVLVSPMSRARETCRLAGYADVAEVSPDLLEWDYGDYEGRSTPEIQKDRPGWSLWRDGVPNGESVEQVGTRVARLIERAAQVQGDVAMFAHGHVLRIMTAVWLGLPPKDGQLFALNTGTMSVLGFEHEYRVIRRWNCSAV
jgi:probable phosphoglycerate mutase